VSRIPTHRLAIFAAVFIGLLTDIDLAVAIRAGRFPDLSLMRVSGTITALLIIYWILSHPRLPQRLRPSFDHGLFLWATLPLALAHHVLVVYRWWGLPVLLGLSLLFLPEVAVIVAYIVA
jgi:hypothetical protein